MLRDLYFSRDGMTAAPSKQALNWEAYESGRFSPGRGSIGSSRVRFDSPSPGGTPDLLSVPQQNGNGTTEGNLRHRRYVHRFLH